MDCLVTPIDSPFQIWLAVILVSWLCNTAKRLHCALDRGEGKARPIYDDKHVETRVETRQKAVRIALGMCAGTKSIAVTRTGAIQGGDWVFSSCPDLERVPILTLALGDVAVLEHRHWSLCCPESLESQRLLKCERH